MHHLFHSGWMPRLLAFACTAVLVLFCVYGPAGRAPVSKVVPLPDHPQAAAVPVPAQSIAPQVRLTPTPVPVPRPQPEPTVDGKNLRGAPTEPRPGVSAGKADAASRSATPKRPKARYRVPGQDISWPQCPGRANQPMPYRDIRFLIIGLTNGPSFTRNPCLGMHLAWARRHHVWTAAYAFATFPKDRQIKRLGVTGPYDGRHWLGRVQNAAWKTAVFNIRTMREHRFVTPHVWLDVEQSSSRPWTGNKQWNRAVLDAWIKAYRDAGYGVGIYSSRTIWHRIMGDHRLRLPEWRTAGPTSARAALARCRERSFQGGHGILAQWWDRRRDYDRMCPGFQDDATMRRFFAKY